MIDLTAYNSYQTFLKSIKATNKLHYFIDDGEFQNAMEIQTLKELGFIHIVQIRRYQNYPSNGHHWTTSFVWDTIIPKLSKDLNIPFNQNDFIKCELIKDGHDLSYHNPVSNSIIKLGLDKNNTISGSFSNNVRCFDATGKQLCDCWTAYHGLFKHYHRCCIVTNCDIENDRVLMINTDSMSIPIIPILIPYFKKIYVLDNRTRTAWLNENVDIAEVTDYVALSLTRSYTFSSTFVYRETSNNKIFTQNLL